MSLTSRHITAGDITPVTVQTESIYGTPTSSDYLYGDVAEGGNFTFMDTPNPHLSWRYGSRGFNADNYVTQQKDAGFRASLEVRDILGWKRIIEFAMTSLGSGSNPLEPMLTSRTEEIYVRENTSVWRGRQYRGCKTNKLTIKADAPGGVVVFDEEVFASKSTAEEISTAKDAWENTSPAVQWMGGMTFKGTDIYPQSFSLTIINNLERVRVPNNGDAITGALLEGRREIEFEADLWMEDLVYVRDSINNASIPDNINSRTYITLGITNKVKLTLKNPKWVADGSNPPLIQDKQRQTIKLRATALTVETVS